MAEQKKYQIKKEAAPKALVISCVDPRFIYATFEFLNNELGYGSGDFSLVSTPGGVVMANVPHSDFSHENKTLVETMTFILNHFKTIDTVIKIAHEQCGKYAALGKALEEYKLDAENMLHKQCADMSAVESMIPQLAGRDIKIRKYLSKFDTAEGQGYFEEVV